MDVNPQAIKAIITDLQRNLSDTERMKATLTQRELIEFLKLGLSEGIEQLMDLLLKADIDAMDDWHETIDYDAATTHNLINQGYSRWTCASLVLWARTVGEAIGFVNKSYPGFSQYGVQASDIQRVNPASDIVVPVVHEDEDEENKLTISTIDEFITQLGGL